VSGLVWGLLAVLVLLGAAAVFVLYGDHAEEHHARLWRALHFNWLFWSSVAMGLVILAVAFQITNARWSWSVRRFALAGVAFLPVSFVLLAVPLFGGKEVLFHHWLGVEGDPVIDAKAAWLNFPALAIRDYLALAVLYGFAIWFAYHQLRPDVYGARNGNPGLYQRLTRGWRGVHEEAARSQVLKSRIAPVTALLFAFVWGMLAIDLAMSMLPHWFSTMFPVAFFVGAFHSALAAWIILVTVFRGQMRLHDYITPRQYHDMGKLLFAFAVFWMYINWSQYVVIWYGLLPHEQEWFVLRFNEPFGNLTQIAVACIFVFPFLTLLPRPMKKTPVVAASVAAVVFVGHWLERFLITVPSVYEGEHLPLGLPEVGVALGMGALFLACYLWFLKSFPVLPSPASLKAAPSPVVDVAPAPAAVS
jgi:multisubunit Na+/H+ antiporter MnhB subunit